MIKDIKLTLVAILTLCVVLGALAGCAMVIGTGSISDRKPDIHVKAIDVDVSKNN